MSDDREAQVEMAAAAAVLVQRLKEDGVPLGLLAAKDEAGAAQWAVVIAASPAMAEKMLAAAQRIQGEGGEVQ